MKKLILIAAIAVCMLASCSENSENKTFNVSSFTHGDEIVISSEPLLKGDTVRIGYDIAGREIASKDLHGSYIGHIAIVE